MDEDRPLAPRTAQPRLPALTAEHPVVTHELPGSRVRIKLPVPEPVLARGESAAHAFMEFFAGIENDHTRDAYLRDCLLFFSWARDQGVTDLEAVTPMMAKAYANSGLPHYRPRFGRTKPRSKPTVQRHLAALTELYHFLVTAGAAPFNPFSSVKRPKHKVKKGKIPILGEDAARRFLEGINCETISGLRDRALIAAMVYSFGRVSAVLAMNGDDYYPRGKRWFFRLREKNGWELEVPVHHKAQDYMDAFLELAGAIPNGPLFRSLTRRRELNQERRLSRAEADAVVKRRARQLRIPEWRKLCCHSWRGTGITNFLEREGSLERAQFIAGHADPKTTKLYDRREEKATLDDIERISI